MPAPPKDPKDPKDKGNGNTPPPQQDRDIKIFAFSNGLNIIAIFESVDHELNILNLKAPVVLTSIIDPDTSDITGFYTSPFMAPYVDFDINKTFQISAVDLFCVEIPNEFVLGKFNDILASFEANVGDASMQVNTPTELDLITDMQINEDVPPPNYAGG